MAKGQNIINRGHAKYAKFFLMLNSFLCSQCEIGEWLYVTDTLSSVIFDLKSKLCVGYVVKCSDVEWSDVIYVKWFCFEVQCSVVKWSEVSHGEVLEDKTAVHIWVLDCIVTISFGVYLVLWSF